jgi:hypothetical protein
MNSMWEINVKNVVHAGSIYHIHSPHLSHSFTTFITFITFLTFQSGSAGLAYVFHQYVIFSTSALFLTANGAGR